MVKKRKADANLDFAFDDDTSDSEEEEGLEDFQMRVGRLKQSEPPTDEKSPGQDGSDEDGDDHDEDDEKEDDNDFAKQPGRDL